MLVLGPLIIFNKEEGQTMSEQNPQPPPASAPSGADLAFPELPWARLREALAHSRRRREGRKV